MRGKILSILDRVESSLEWIDTVAIFALWIVAISEVFFRDVLNSPLTWSLDVTLLIMIWMTMIGSGSGVRSDLHIKVAFFIDGFSEKIKKILEIISFGVIFYFGIYMILGSYSMAILPGIIADLGISNAFLYIPVMIGGAISILFAFERGLRLFLNKSEGSN